MCLAAVSVISNCACEKAPHEHTAVYQVEPETYLANELSRYKVVMLGDIQHGGALPWQSLLSVLDHWSTSLQADRHAPRDLTLFLECTEEAADILSSYLQTGDWERLLDYYLPSGTLERLEFYADLREAVSRLPGPEEIESNGESQSLWVRGAEPWGIYDRPAITREEAYRCFVEERDEAIAAGILDHLRDYPKRHVLVFYGNLHLIANRVTKPSAPPGYPAERREGYYLAHYLKRALGEEAVLTVNQMAHPTHGSDARPDWDDERDILVEWSEIPSDWLAPVQIGLEYDFVILRHLPLVAKHPLRQICCRRIVDSSLADLERMAPHEDVGFFAARQTGVARRALALSTGKTYDEPSLWRRWWSTHDYDGAARLMSPAFSDQVLDLIGDLRRQDRNAAPQLMGLGLPLRDFHGILAGAPAVWRLFWDQHRTEVWTLQAIGMLWCGDNEESSWARRYLTDISGHDFDEPQDAMKWWRTRYREVPY